MQHKFTVSHHTLPTKADRSDFISYLQCKHLVIDVYDGDSLIFIGSANVPLKVHVRYIITTLFIIILLKK